jgi:hypothetical protein
VKLIVVVANVGLTTRQALERNRASFTATKDLIVSLDSFTAASICDVIATKYIRVGPSEDYETFSVVFAVNTTAVAIDEMRKALPGLLILPTPALATTPNAGDHTALIGFLRRELVHVRKLLAAIRKEIRERDTKTPLLLPVRNFKSSSLLPLLVGVQQLRPTVPDYDVPVRKFVDAAGISSQRKGTGKKNSFFMDNRSLEFCGPTKAGARHGKPGLDDGTHRHECLVNAYFRLGVRYDVAFHYDCSAGGHIKGQFPNCHDAVENVSARTHVNISPNDFVR